MLVLEEKSRRRYTKKEKKKERKGTVYSLTKAENIDFCVPIKEKQTFSYSFLRALTNNVIYHRYFSHL